MNDYNVFGTDSYDGIQRLWEDMSWKYGEDDSDIDSKGILFVREILYYSNVNTSYVNLNEIIDTSRINNYKKSKTGGNYGSSKKRKTT